MAAIYEAVTEFRELGAHVLSPADPRVVDQIGEFLFVASDRVRSIKMVEDRHLECIRASDFLWLVAPDGYVGQSASMELGYAVAHGVPIFCLAPLMDGTLDKYVQLVPGIRATLLVANGARHMVPGATFLIQPLNAINEAHDRLDDLQTRLTRSSRAILDGEEGDAILRDRDALTELLSPPGRIRCAEPAPSTGLSPSTETPEGWNCRL
jgi:hypothetical protein